jgi:hypothetical protein
MRFILAFLLFLAITMFAKASFDTNFAKRCVWYSGQAYCDPDDYLSRTYVGDAAGFVPTYQIYNFGDDTNGYIGYNPNYNEIVVVFRGTQSVRNWLDNLTFWKTNYPHCSGCEVHKGFYKTMNKVIDDVKNEVFALKSQFPSYSVTVTGHSLGAALALLTALELRQSGVSLNMYNFGNPRVGNDEFYDWVKASGDVNYRVVHDNDIVPHTPPNSFGFHHIATEIWEQADGTLKTCNGSGEDQSCSWGCDAKDYSVDDHHWYLGIALSCDGVTARIEE